ncbi:hypothetical protein TNCV_3405371 [Trichonephila clavipes]|nr:hypothetical protein TNCV_3405371 [Trichonephila clavipes]
MTSQPVQIDFGHISSKRAYQGRLENPRNRLGFTVQQRGVLRKSQKLLKKAPTSKDAGLKPPMDGMSNISKYPGYLPDFTCYDGNPRNQGLV